MIRLARWVQENLKEGPRVRGGRVTEELQSKRDRDAAYVPVREPSTYLKKLRDNLFWSRLGSRPTWRCCGTIHTDILPQALTYLTS